MLQMPIYLDYLFLLLDISFVYPHFCTFLSWLYIYITPFSSQVASMQKQLMLARFGAPVTPDTTRNQDGIPRISQSPISPMSPQSRRQYPNLYSSPLSSTTPRPHVASPFGPPAYSGDGPPLPSPLRPPSNTPQPDHYSESGTNTNKGARSDVSAGTQHSQSHPYYSPGVTDAGMRGSQLTVPPGRSRAANESSTFSTVSRTSASSSSTNNSGSAGSIGGNSVDSGFPALQQETAAQQEFLSHHEQLMALMEESRRRLLTHPKFAQLSPRSQHHFASLTFRGVDVLPLLEHLPMTRQAGEHGKLADTRNHSSSNDQYPRGTQPPPGSVQAPQPLSPIHSVSTQYRYTLSQSTNTPSPTEPSASPSSDGESRGGECDTSTSSTSHNIRNNNDNMSNKSHTMHNAHVATSNSDGVLVSNSHHADPTSPLPPIHSMTQSQEINAMEPEFKERIRATYDAFRRASLTRDANNPSLSLHHMSSADTHSIPKSSDQPPSTKFPHFNFSLTVDVNASMEEPALPSHRKAITPIHRPPPLHVFPTNLRISTPVPIDTTRSNPQSTSEKEGNKSARQQRNDYTIPPLAASVDSFHPPSQATDRSTSSHGPIPPTHSRPTSRMGLSLASLPQPDSLLHSLRSQDSVISPPGNTSRSFGLREVGLGHGLGSRSARLHPSAEEISENNLSTRSRTSHANIYAFPNPNVSDSADHTHSTQHPGGVDDAESKGQTTKASNTHTSSPILNQAQRDAFAFQGGLEPLPAAQVGDDTSSRETLSRPNSAFSHRSLAESAPSEPSHEVDDVPNDLPSSHPSFLYNRTSSEGETMDPTEATSPNSPVRGSLRNHKPTRSTGTVGSSSPRGFGGISSLPNAANPSRVTALHPYIQAAAAAVGVSPEEYAEALRQAHGAVEAAVSRVSQASSQTRPGPDSQHGGEPITYGDHDGPQNRSPDPSLRRSPTLSPSPSHSSAQIHQEQNGNSEGPNSRQSLLPSNAPDRSPGRFIMVPYGPAPQPTVTSSLRPRQPSVREQYHPHSSRSPPLPHLPGQIPSTKANDASEGWLGHGEASSSFTEAYYDGTRPAPSTYSGHSITQPGSYGPFAGRHPPAHRASQAYRTSSNWSNDGTATEDSSYVQGFPSDDIYKHRQDAPPLAEGLADDSYREEDTFPISWALRLVAWRKFEAFASFWVVIFSAALAAFHFNQSDSTTLALVRIFVTQIDIVFIFIQCFYISPNISSSFCITPYFISFFSCLADNHY